MSDTPAPVEIACGTKVGPLPCTCVLALGHHELPESPHHRCQHGAYYDPASDPPRFYWEGER